MAKKTKRKMISASTLRKKASKKDVTSISNSVEKLVQVNKDLQTKISDLMVKVTVLTGEVKDMVDMMRASGFKPPEEVMPKMPGLPEVSETPDLGFPEEEETKPKTRITSDIKLLAEQNVELTKTLRALEEQLKKESTKEAIKRALEKSRGR